MNSWVETYPLMNANTYKVLKSKFPLEIESGNLEKTTGTLGGYLRQHQKPIPSQPVMLVLKAPGNGKGFT